MRARGVPWAAVLAAVLLGLSGCGGGSGAPDVAKETASTPQPPPPNPPASPPSAASFEVVAAAQAELGLPVALRTSLGAQVATGTVRWDFGDGQTGTHAQPLHAWWKPGEYSVKVSLNDLSGNAHSAMHRVVVRAAPEQPASTCSGPNQTGWCTLPPVRVSRGHPLLHWQFIDAQRGWAVAATAPLAKQADPSNRYIPGHMAGRELQQTLDGGRTWTTLYADPAATWTNVVMVNASVGYLHSQAAEGVAPVLLRTQDGGRHWQSLTLPAATVLRGVFVVGERNLHIELQRSLIPGTTFYRSTDGGSSWVEGNIVVRAARHTRSAMWSCDTGRLHVHRADSAAFEAVADAPRCNAELHADQRLIAFFLAGSDAEMRLSEDEGNTWTTSMMGTRPGGASRPRNLALYTGGKSWGWDGVLRVNGTGVSSLELFHSADYGRNWRSVQLPPLRGDAVVSTVELDGDTALLHDAHTSWLTLDGGQSWQAIAIPRAWIDGAPGAQRDAGGALQVGAFRSLDNGQSWIDLPALREVAWPTELLFYDRDNGVGFDGAGRFALTADGGRSWQPVDTGHRPIVDRQTPTSLALRRDNLGNTWALSRGALLRSVDRGRSWTTVPLPPAMERQLNMLAVAPAGDLWVGTALCWLQDPLGWGQSCTFRTQTLHRSTDQGASWTVIGGVETGWIVSLVAPESGVALAASSDGVVRRYFDGGTRWQDMPLGPGTLQFVDGRHGWYFDARVQHLRLRRTTDGGRTWQEVTGLPGEGLPSAENKWVWAPLFTSAETGWMLALDGRIAVTVDGGVSWSERQTAPGLGLFAFDDQTLWVSDGTPARTITGGR